MRKRFRLNLRATAIERGYYSQAALARATGIAQATIRPLWNGYAERVSLSVLARLCDVLHCALTDIVTENGYEHVEARINEQ